MIKRFPHLKSLFHQVLRSEENAQRRVDLALPARRADSRSTAVWAGSDGALFKNVLTVCFDHSGPVAPGESRQLDVPRPPSKRGSGRCGVSA